MAEQQHDANALRRLPPHDSAAARASETRDDINFPRRRSSGGVNTALGGETIFFRNHLGDRYVWPFEHCRTSEVRLNV